MAHFAANSFAIGFAIGFGYRLLAAPYPPRNGHIQQVSMPSQGFAPSDLWLNWANKKQKLVVKSRRFP